MRLVLQYFVFGELALLQVFYKHKKGLFNTDIQVFHEVNETVFST